MGSEGYLINQFLAARTNDRTTSGAARPRAGCASPSRSYAARASWSATTSRSSTGSRCSTSSRAARPGTRSSSSRCTLEAGRRHRPQHRHRLARGAGADDHHPGAARRLGARHTARLKRGRRRPGLRVQPDQHPRAGRGDPRRRRGRPGLDGAAAAGRPGVRRQGGGRAAPTRSTPASPATRPASTTSSSNKRASCLVNPRACHETELVLLPVPASRPRTRRRRRRRSGRPRGRDGPPPSAASRSRSSRRRPSSAASSAWRWQVPGKEDFAETLRYFTRRLEVLGVDVRLGTDGRPPPTSPASTRSSSRPASSRGCRRSPASTTAASRRTPTC